MVLSAHTDGPQNTQKFVTLIAQPDLYGNPLVLLKNVTDVAHLDETATNASRRCRGRAGRQSRRIAFRAARSGQRQFALYRVLRGTAEKIFVTGGGEFGVAPGE